MRSTLISMISNGRALEARHSVFIFLAVAILILPAMTPGAVMGEIYEPPPAAATSSGFTAEMPAGPYSPSTPGPGGSGGTEQIILSLTHPDEPGVMIFQHHKGTITITGYSGEYIIINARLRYPSGRGSGTGGPAGKAEGSGSSTEIQPVAGHALRLNGIEKNNVITISSNSHERTIDLDIQLPRRFSIHLEKLDNGSISLYSLSGEIEVSSESGDVSLSDIDGTAVLNTVEGDIRADFEAVTPDVPMAFTSLTGNIELFLPEDTGASLKMRADHGEIMTDFDIDVAKKAASGEKSSETGIQRAFLDEWTQGIIGGGGSQFLIRSYNGNIYIRKNRNVSREVK